MVLPALRNKVINSWRSVGTEILNADDEKKSDRAIDDFHYLNITSTHQENSCETSSWRDEHCECTNAYFVAHADAC